MDVDSFMTNTELQDCIDATFDLIRKSEPGATRLLTLEKHLEDLLNCQAYRASLMRSESELP